MNARTMIVTGASAGIGRALTVRAVAAGYGVVAVARRAELLDALTRALEGAPGEIETVVADLLDPDAAARIVSASLRRFARIDVVVNNAGSVAGGRIIDQGDAALREQFNLHSVAPLALLREALPALQATRGHVFFVGSGVARSPVPGLGAYPSAKAAVRNAARIARMELRPLGIAVTYVDPGAVDTAFMERAGFTGAPKHLRVSPDTVARRILRAVKTRAPVVNAAPWQTAVVALGEFVPSLADALITRFPAIAGTQRAERPPSAAPPTVAAAPAPEEPASGEPEPPATAFDGALAPHARRMERLNLSRAAVAGWLVPGTMIGADDIALRWAGMPNKNERALVTTVLEALADAAFLQRLSPGTYAVVRPSGEGYQ